MKNGMIFLAVVAGGVLFTIGVTSSPHYKFRAECESNPSKVIVIDMNRNLRCIDKDQLEKYPDFPGRNK